MRLLYVVGTCLLMSCVSAVEMTGRASGRASGLEEVAGWNFLNFAGADSRTFPAQDPVFTGVTVWKDRIFLSLPRLRENVPATLAWIPRTPRAGLNPPLVPFPDWSWQEGHRNNCSGLASVYRSRVDRCGRLWVLDSGVTLQRNPVCPPRIFIFDLEHSLLVRVVTVPRHVLRANSILTFSVFDYVDHSPSCDNMFLYMADTLGYGLIVHDVMQGAFWRYEDMTFRMDPRYSRFQIAGESATVQDGILGMAISYLGEEKMLYYHPFAGVSLYAVPVGALRVPNTQGLPVTHVLEQTSQGVGMTADEEGTVVFSPLSETALVTWSPRTFEQRLLAEDARRLQFVPDMEVDHHDGAIWMITNRFQSWSSNTYDPRGINLRVLRFPRAAAPSSQQMVSSYNPFSWKNFFSFF